MEIFGKEEREMVKMELNPEKLWQNRRNLRANKEDIEGAIRDMTTEKQNCKKPRKEVELPGENDKCNTDNKSNKRRLAKDLGVC